MAAYTDQPPRSRRYIRLYLSAWAFMAVAALGYLGLLAMKPQHGAAPKTQVADADPSQAMRALAKTANDMHTVRRSLSDIQTDVAHLKDAAAAREAEDKAMATRLSAVEEKLANMQPGDAGENRPKVSERNQRRMADARARVINVMPDSPAPAVPPAAKDEGPPVPLITGSIGRKEATPKEEITFGEPVITRTGAGAAFAVQLAASPSLQGLKQSWGQLRERHGALAALEPRVVAPRSDGGPYRLLAGPFATKADADRVCSDMGVGRNGCYVTSYTGAPL